MINNTAPQPRAVTDGDTILATVDLFATPERVFRYALNRASRRLRWSEGAC